MTSTNLLILLSFAFLFVAILGVGWSLDEAMTEIKEELKKLKEDGER